MRYTGREKSTPYEEHLATWGPNCGAPFAVYKGHLDALLEDIRQREMDRCCNVITSLAAAQLFSSVASMVRTAVEKIRSRM